MKTLKLGTRGSKLALIQAGHVKGALESLHEDIHVEIVIIKTSGDWSPAQGEVALSEAQGGKGQFIKEIERALASGEIDCGVHSLKDVPAILPDGFMVSHILRREDPRDVLLCRDAQVKTISDLPKGAVIGTSSKRRSMFALAARPDCKTTILRGNVDTRMEKLRNGQVDATFLAAAGLSRMGLLEAATGIIPVDDMIPCAGQGAICLEIRQNDQETQVLLDPVHDEETALCCIAERAVLAATNASCHTPIGVYAQWREDNHIYLRATIGMEDGSQIFAAEDTMHITTEDEAMALGLRLAEDLMQKTPLDVQGVLGVGLAG